MQKSCRKFEKRIRIGTRMGMMGRRRGMVLVEAVIYAFLLSFLLSTLLSYAYILRKEALQILDGIRNENSASRSSPTLLTRGFSAVIATVIVSIGLFALAALSAGAAADFADTVFRKELRIQARLNARACLDLGLVHIAKNVFIEGSLIRISDIGCDLEVSRVGESGQIGQGLGQPVEMRLVAKTQVSGVSAKGERAVTLDDGALTITSESY